MKKTLLALVAAVSFSASASALNLDCLNGFYTGAFGGANWVADDVAGADYRFKTGYMGGVSAGYWWQNGLRTELEYSYRHNRLENIVENGQKFNFGGSIQSRSYMVNALYDLPLCNWYVNPYIGAGIGYANQSFTVSDDQFVLKGKASGFAYQAIGGVAYPINENVDVTAEYRFHKGQIKAFDHSVGLGVKYYF